MKYDCLPLNDQERAAYIAGDIQQAEILGLAIDTEAELLEAQNAATKAEELADELREALRRVVAAADYFMDDSEQDIVATKGLREVLDDMRVYL